jgi:hypothetical protein
MIAQVPLFRAGCAGTRLWFYIALTGAAADLRRHPVHRRDGGALSTTVRRACGMYTVSIA